MGEEHPKRLVGMGSVTANSELRGPVYIREDAHREALAEKDEEIAGLTKELAERRARDREVVAILDRLEPKIERCGNGSLELIAALERANARADTMEQRWQEEGRTGGKLIRALNDMTALKVKAEKRVKALEADRAEVAATVELALEDEVWRCSDAEGKNRAEKALRHIERVYNPL